MRGRKSLPILVLLSIILLMSSGCARRLNQSSFQRNLSAGTARVGDLNSSADETFRASDQVVDVKSNSATGVATITNGAKPVGDDLAQISANTQTDNSTAVASPVGTDSSEQTDVKDEQRKDKPTAIRRLFNWGNDSDSKNGTAEDNKQTQENAPDQVDEETEETKEEKAESRKIFARTRGRRLLAMLGLDWGKDEPEESDSELVEDVTALAETEMVEQDSADPSTEQEAEADAETAPEEPGIVELRQTGGDEETGSRKVNGAIPLPVGVSNRAIETTRVPLGKQNSDLMDFPESTADSGTSQVPAEMSESLDEEQASALTLQAGEDVSAANARRLSRQMAMRRAMLPGTKEPFADTHETHSDVQESSTNPAAVVKIPNRLDLPSPKPVVRTWETKSFKKWFPIAGLAVAGLCIVGTGLWRRIRGPKKDPPTRRRRKLFSRTPKSLG